MIDVQRFIAEFGEIWCGAVATSVDVAHAPTPLNTALGPDPLTGDPPAETRITVKVRDDLRQLDSNSLSSSAISISARRCCRPLVTRRTT